MLVGVCTWCWWMLERGGGEWAVGGGAKNISASLSLLSVWSPRAHLFLQRREHANRTLEAYQSLGTMEQQLQASVEEYNGRKKALLELFKSMLPFVQSTFVKVCSLEPRCLRANDGDQW